QRDLHRARFSAQPGEELEEENAEHAADEQSLNFSKARADISRDEEPMPDDRSIFSLSNMLALAVTNILARKESSTFMGAQALYFQRNPNFARAYLESNLTKQKSAKDILESQQTPHDKAIAKLRGNLPQHKQKD